MLTEAYTSLLAALTAWDPAEGETQTCSDEDKPEIDRKTKGYSGSDKRQETCIDKQSRQVGKRQGRTGGLTDRKIVKSG